MGLLNLICATLVLFGGTSTLAEELPLGEPRLHGVRSRQTKALRRELNTVVESGNIRGVSLLVAHNGEVIFKESFGKISVDQRVPIASATKPLTATAFMMAAERFAFSTEDPIASHLPQFKRITNYWVILML